MKAKTFRRAVVLFAAVLVLGLLSIGGRFLQRANAKSPCSASQVAAGRAAVDGSCNCATASDHGAYVRCANDAVSAAHLPPGCRGQVMRCAARSTCGKPGFVTCCRTTASGKTRCTIKRDAPHCRAPRGGSAATGTGSCCDNCGGAACGNGPVEPPEECDPPASSCTGAFAGETCQGDCTCASPSGAFLESAGLL